MSSLKQTILDANDLKSVVESVPEWGVEVRFKQLTAEATLKMTEEMDLPENKGLGMFLVIIASAINEDGTPIFTRDDIEALKKKSLPVLNRLQRVALRVNAMLPEDGSALKKG